MLAVTAARLGKRHVLALDVDPKGAESHRRQCSNERCRRGGLSDRCALNEVPGYFDLVVANIGATALVDMARHVIGLLAPRGALVLAGMLEEHAGGRRRLPPFHACRLAVEEAGRQPSFAP